MNQNQMEMAKTQKAKPAQKSGEYTLSVDEYSCQLNTPNRGIIEMAMSKMGIAGGQSEMIKAGEIILRGCWVDGDDEILNNDQLLVACALKAFQLIEMKEVELKKN